MLGGVSWYNFMHSKLWHLKQSPLSSFGRICGFNDAKLDEWTSDLSYRNIRHCQELCRRTWIDQLLLAHASRPGLHYYIHWWWDTLNFELNLGSEVLKFIVDRLPMDIESVICNQIRVCLEVIIRRDITNSSHNEAVANRSWERVVCWNLVFDLVCRTAGSW